MSLPNPFIRSPFLDEYQPALDLAAAQAPQFPTAAPAAVPVVPAAAVVAASGKENGIVQFLKSLFTDPKKRTIVIVVSLLIALGIGLFFVHRSFQRRKRRADEDEEAQEQLSAGQQERENNMDTAPSGGSGAGGVVVHPPPSSSSGFQQPGWDQSVGTSAQQNDRRMQDAQFRAYQQQQQQMGAFPPGQQQPYPLSPGQLPNLNVNPNATGSPGQMGPPLPGSPEEGGYDPI